MLVDRTAFRAAMEDLCADPSAHAAIHDAAPIPVPDDVTRWLTGLTTLAALPFSYVVADPAFLPPESIRFFCLDSAWIDAAVQGAGSIGRTSTWDLSQDAALVPLLLAAAATPRAASGFLLRSRVVDNYPRLEVTAYNANGPIDRPPLRMARLAPAVLLYLVDDIVTKVELHEPAEGIHFGLTDQGKVELRGLGTAQHPAGAPIKGADQDVPLRARTGAQPGGRVVRLGELAGRIQDKLDALGARTRTGTLSAAELAPQLVQPAQSGTFDVDSQAGR